MNFKSNFGFYGILTKPTLGYEPLAQIMSDLQIAFIQLRIKDQPRAAIKQVATRIRKIVKSPSLFIVNDDVELANEVGADGVHLGQDDTPYEQARSFLGTDAIIGLSTHNPSQTQAACDLAPDYIGIGPVYATPTKQIPDPVLGIEGMNAMLSVASVPAVCLGGIDHSNVEAVIAGGARNVCAVRCINVSEDPKSELLQMISTIGRCSKLT